MPSPIKIRLQRRLAEKKKAAGALPNSPAESNTQSGPADIPSERASSNAPNSNIPSQDHTMTVSALEEAEKCGRSLVEELSTNDLILFFGFPDDWSYHRRITAISVGTDPTAQFYWLTWVKKYGLSCYYARKSEQISVKLNDPVFKKSHGLGGSRRNRIARTVKALREGMMLVDLANLSIGDALLAAIVGHLPDPERFDVDAVCRRWHFVARCSWNLSASLRLSGSNSKFCYDKTDAHDWEIGFGLRPSKLTYRVPLLTSIAFGDAITVRLESLLPCGKALAFLTSLQFYHVVLSSKSNVSFADANEKVCQFISDLTQLEELVLDRIYVKQLDVCEKVGVNSMLQLLSQGCGASGDNRRRASLRGVQLAAWLLVAHDQESLTEFWRRLRKRKMKAFVLLLGHPEFPEAVFVPSFADLMPRLREISFCNITSAAGIALKGSSMDLLAKNIRHNSNLELFCLTNGEISEEAISNLQRCRNLQILILLRCTITKADSALRLMAGWHPNANLPSSLITDCVTVPRWFKPTYFRVVRIKNFSDFNGAKFAELRKRWWTIGTLLKLGELVVYRFCFCVPSVPTIHMNTQKPVEEAEDILSDTRWIDWKMPAVSKI